eukprot:tig00020956_g16510.t1
MMIPVRHSHLPNSRVSWGAMHWGRRVTWKPVLWPSCRCHHLPLRRSPTKLLFNKVSQERVYLVHVAVVRYEKSQMVTANDRILQLSSFKSTEKSIKSVVHLLMHRISPRRCC